MSPLEKVQNSALPLQWDSSLIASPKHLLKGSHVADAISGGIVVVEDGEMDCPECHSSYFGDTFVENDMFRHPRRRSWVYFLRS